MLQRRGQGVRTAWLRSHGPKYRRYCANQHVVPRQDKALIQPAGGQLCIGAEVVVTDPSEQIIVIR